MLGVKAVGGGGKAARYWAGLQGAGVGAVKWWE